MWNKNCISFGFSIFARNAISHTYSVLRKKLFQERSTEYFGVLFSPLSFLTTHVFKLHFNNIPRCPGSQNFSYYYIYHTTLSKLFPISRSARPSHPNLDDHTYSSVNSDSYLRQPVSLSQFHSPIIQSASSCATHNKWRIKTNARIYCDVTHCRSTSLI